MPGSYFAPIDFSSAVVIAVACFLSCLDAGLATTDRNSSTAELRIAGSSTVFLVAQAWQNLLPNAHVYTIDGGGSSIGARRVCAAHDDPDHVDIGGMSRDWRTSEAERLDDGSTLECLDKATGQRTGRRITQLQVGIDGLAVVVRKHGVAHNCLVNPDVGGLTMAQLRWIFSDWTDAELEDSPYGNLNFASVVPDDDGDGIKEWSDINEACDEVPINPYGAGDESGTHDFFSDAVFNGDADEGFVHCNLTEVHHLEGLSTAAAATYIQTQRASLGSVNCYASSEDDGLIKDWILADTGGIAYFGYAYYKQNTAVLTVTPIANDRVNGISDTEEFVVFPDHFSIADGSYNMFTRVLYMNVANTAWDLVRDYLLMGFSEDGQQAVADIGYVKINRAVRTRMENRIQEGENLEADYVPIPPEECANGTELQSLQYINPSGILKENYTCSPCEPGYFKWANTPTLCEQCEPGRIAAQSGRSACDACPSGHYAESSTTCAPCFAGTFVALPGATQCELCPPGQVQAEKGGSECAPCAAGKYQNRSGQSECIDCEPGHFASAPSLTSCISCEPGYYQADPGASKPCSRCPIGNWTNESSAVGCGPCLPGLTTQYTGAYSIEQCVCARGTYMPIGKNSMMEHPCVDCPAGMQCQSGSAERYLPTQPSYTCPDDMECLYPLVDKGHMSLIEEPLKVYRCLLEEHCPGGAPAQCALYRAPDGVACGECEEEPAAYPRGDECQPCGAGPNILLIIGAAIFLITVLCAATFAVNKDMVKQSAATITIAVITGLTFTGFQSLGVFSALNLNWFEPMKSIISFVSVFGFDLSILRMSCNVGSNPLVTYTARQLVAPLSVVVVFGALMVKKMFLKKDTRVLVELLNTVGAVYSVFFISVVISAMAPFICYHHPGDNGSSMVSLPSVLCYEDDVWFGLMAEGFASLILVVVPFITICIYGTWCHTSWIRSNELAWLTAYRFLFMRFTADRYFYGTILLARNFLIPCIPALVRGDIAFQVLLLSLVLLFFLVVQQFLKPWRTQMVNVFDAILTSLLLIVLVCGTASSDFKAEEESIGLLGTCLFAAVLVVVTVAFLKISFDRLWPANAYDAFICHHKAGAASQARFLKILLFHKAKQKVFIDADNLQQLDGLFDIVRTNVSRLIVYLSQSTLSRPWCCGEIVTAFVSRVSTVVVMALNFQMPEKRDKEDWSRLLDFNNSCLIQYGITLDTVTEAYKWVLSGTLPKINVRPTYYGRGRVEQVAIELLNKGGSRDSQKPLALDGLKSVLLCSDPDDDEASATAGILCNKIGDRVSDMGFGSVVCLCDADPKQLEDHETDQLLALVRDTRACIVLLTPHTMRSILQLKVIYKAACLHANVIPVSTPLYNFPTENYYTTILPSLSHRVTFEDADIVLKSVQSFFKTIAVHLGTHSSNKVIEAQAFEILKRMQKAREDAEGRSASGGSYKLNSLPTEGSGRMSVRSRIGSKPSYRSSKASQEKRSLGHPDEVVPAERDKTDNIRSLQTDFNKTVTDEDVLWSSDV